MIVAERRRPWDDEGKKHGEDDDPDGGLKDVVRADEHGHHE